MVEHLSSKQKVEGSSPPLVSTYAVSEPRISRRSYSICVSRLPTITF